MLVTSFTELGTQAPMIYRTLRGLVQEARIQYGEKRGHDISHITGGIPEGDPDPAPAHEQVRSLVLVFLLDADLRVLVCRFLACTGSLVSLFLSQLR